MLLLKKIYVVLAGIIVTIFTFSPNVLAEENTDSNTNNIDNEIYEEQLDNELLAGEEVIDFYREVPTSIELIRDPVILDLNDNENQGGEISVLSRQPRWLAMSKSYQGLKYGPWLYAGASTLSGGTLSASHSSTVSNTFSGSLNATSHGVSALVGFDISKSYSKAVTYTSPSYKKIANKGHRLQYRHVYKGYSVKQQKKYATKSKVSYGTSYVYPKKWIERQYRVVTFKQ